MSTAELSTEGLAIVALLVEKHEPNGRDAVTIEVEAQLLWAANREMFDALQSGDLETARIAREEIEAAALHSDFPAIRSAAARTLAGCLVGQAPATLYKLTPVQ